jgi:hypothetical protein
VATGNLSSACSIRQTSKRHGHRHEDIEMSPLPAVPPLPTFSYSPNKARSTIPHTTATTANSAPTNDSPDLTVKRRNTADEFVFQTGHLPSSKLEVRPASPVVAAVSVGSEQGTRAITPVAAPSSSPPRVRRDPYKDLASRRVKRVLRHGEGREELGSGLG